MRFRMSFSIKMARVVIVYGVRDGLLHHCLPDSDPLHVAIGINDFHVVPEGYHSASSTELANLDINSVTHCCMVLSINLNMDRCLHASNQWCLLLYHSFTVLESLYS